VVKSTSFFTLITLFLTWLGLMSWPSELNSIVFLFFSVCLSYFFAKWLNLIPSDIKFTFHAISYFFWLIKEIIKSSIAITKIIWRKELNLNPTFEWVDSEQNNDIALVIYANSITLTPGTVTLDIKDNMLLVHALEQNSLDDLKGSEFSMAKRVNKIIRN